MRRDGRRGRDAVARWRRRPSIPAAHVLADAGGTCFERILSPWRPVGLAAVWGVWWVEWVNTGSTECMALCHFLSYGDIFLNGALCYMAFGVAWRYVLHGALCCMALYVAWRFVPRGASPVALSGPPYVALSGQKAPHREATETSLIIENYYQRKLLRQNERFLVATPE